MQGAPHTLQGELHTCTQGPHPGKAFSVGKLDWVDPPAQTLTVLGSDPLRSAPKRGRSRGLPEQPDEV